MDSTLAGIHKELSHRRQARMQRLTDIYRTVTDKDNNVYVIHAGESISFPPNEGRGLKNESGKPAKMLVIINYPDA